MNIFEILSRMSGGTANADFFIDVRSAAPDSPGLLEVQQLARYGDDREQQIRQLRAHVDALAYFRDLAFERIEALEKEASQRRIQNVINWIAIVAIVVFLMLHVHAA